MTKIAFIGLGNMGAPMAANLVKAGHAVIAFDLVDAAKTAAAASGVSIAASAREAVAQADKVVTMLPAGKHVLAAHADFLPAARKDALVIDCSTIDVDSAKKAHEAGAAAARSRAAAERSKAATLCWALAWLAAMPAPILPRPMKAIFVMRLPDFCEEAPKRGSARTVRSYHLAAGRKCHDKPAPHESAL